MSFDPNGRSRRNRMLAASVVTVLSLILVAMFIAVLATRPGLLAAWFGIICFGIAALGGATTVILERRKGRN